MTLVEFVSTYGYLAVLAGALLEGESILLLAGFAAHQGMLSLPLVLFVAFVGGLAGDQMFFFAGRRWGGPLLARSPRLQVHAVRVGALLRRWDAALVVGVRFMYGLRIAGPVAMGALRFSRMRFVIFNTIGAALWSVLVGGTGYLVGHGLQMMIGRIEEYQGAILWGAVVVLACGVGLRRLLWMHRVRAARRARARAVAAPAELPFER
jgi:membrane protein DedA with SNARE-associated domain